MSSPRYPEVFKIEAVKQFTDHGSPVAELTRPSAYPTIVSMFGSNCSGLIIPDTVLGGTVTTGVQWQNNVAHSLPSSNWKLHPLCSARDTASRSQLLDGGGGNHPPSMGAATAIRAEWDDAPQQGADPRAAENPGAGSPHQPA